ncbi:dbbdb5a0-9ef0-4ec8-ad23-f2250980fed9 [Thermothielavioides terrestris]|uniref:Dbbdb5a0-9ef0-4ec8-ad23-f2250980fed9 n=1 Tax=Thermothielavioides terrestris TaxID=2587410 RepID=A0A3S4C090_9PEZI|nr:dbbdb5a0-9ef0-4ec8-ad23-f2250980fed9 [Thermothielavioides terrestris]
MRLSCLLLASALLGDAAVSAAVAPPFAEVAAHQPYQDSKRDAPSYEDLWKRKGGGGGGGRGGGGGSSGGSSGSSSGSSSSGGGRGGSSGSSGSSSSGSSGSGASGGRGSSSSNAGGRTTTGSGPAPVYGGGRYYSGGAAVPYTAGSRSPSGLVPAFFIGSALAFWPGVWLYGAQLYHFNHPYSFYNASSKQNETKPVTCGCDPYNECSCDENGDNQYMKDLVGNGSYAGLNKSVINVANVNGTSTILINGTLPNGTTAAGGSESPNAAGDGLHGLLQHAGWWPVVATVCAIVLTA